MLQVTPRLQIPDDELSVSFALSGGPGGQNVNKVATKVELRFALERSRVLSAEVKARIRAKHPSQVTLAGELLVVSARHRSQLQNRHDAEQRLCELIRAALVRPKPRRPTQVSKAQKRRRREDKRKRGDLKKSRGRVSGDD